MRKFVIGTALLFSTLLSANAARSSQKFSSLPGPAGAAAYSTTRAVALADEEEERIKKNLAKLSPADRKLVEEQKICPIEDEKLGAAGVPIKLIIKGEPVFICCKGCKEEAEKKPEETLKKVAELKKKNKK